MHEIYAFSCLDRSKIDQSHNGQIQISHVKYVSALRMYYSFPWPRRRSTWTTWSRGSPAHWRIGVRNMLPWGMGVRCRHTGGDSGDGSALAHNARDRDLAAGHGAGCLRVQVLLLGAGGGRHPLVLLQAWPIPSAAHFLEQGVDLTLGAARLTGPSRVDPHTARSTVVSKPLSPSGAMATPGGRCGGVAAGATR